MTTEEILICVLIIVLPSIPSCFMITYTLGKMKGYDLAVEDYKRITGK